MKPRSNKERKILELSRNLPNLRQIDSEWIDTTFAKTNKGLYYFVILERCSDYQVIRYYIKTKSKKAEIMQIWLNGSEEYVIARQRCLWVDSWRVDTDMSIKRINKYACYSYLGDMRLLPYSFAKIRSLLPGLKRAGLKTSLHGLHPYLLCKALLGDNKIETLFKLRQYYLVNEFYYCPRIKVEDIWQTIRIALRHGFAFDSCQVVRDWLDMINDLRYLGMDIHNSFYICPTDLAAAHQHWTNLRHKHEELDRLHAEFKHAADYEPIFRATREQFFDMVLTDGEIDIRVIQTAQGIKEEGIAMHHCVGNYYNKSNSLILSAKINGERIETIEVNLVDYTLVQSRGLQNKSSNYHQRIVDLVNANLDIIKVLDVNHKATERRELKKLKKTA